MYVLRNKPTSDSSGYITIVSGLYINQIKNKAEYRTTAPHLESFSRKTIGDRISLMDASSNIVNFLEQSMERTNRVQAS